MEARPGYVLEADRDKTVVHHVAEGELFGVVRLMTGQIPPAQQALLPVPPNPTQKFRQPASRNPHDLLPLALPLPLAAPLPPQPPAPPRLVPR